MDDFLTEMMREHLRLEVRQATMRIVRQKIKAESLVLKARLEAIHAVLKIYTGENHPTDNADSYIASQYRLGWPASFMISVLDDVDAANDGTWTEDRLIERAAELGVSRPIGWTIEKAATDFDAVRDAESDDWLDMAYGLPEPTAALDRRVVTSPVEKPLLLAAPPPPSVDFQKLHDGMLAKIGGCTSVSDLTILSRGKQFRIDHEILSRERRDLSGAVLAAMGEREEVVKQTRREQHPHPTDPNFIPLKTPERVALLKELWETTRLTKQEMADRLNALHGLPMSSSRVGESILAWKIAESAAEANRPPLPVKNDEKYSGPILETQTNEPPTITFGPSVGDEPKVALTEAALKVGFRVDETTQPVGFAQSPSPTPTVEAAEEVQNAPAAEREVPASGTTIAELAVQKKPYVPPSKPTPTFSFTAPAPPTPKPKPSPPPSAPINLGPPRLAKALMLPDPLPTTDEPIEADAATIRAMADAWGLTFRGSVDLWAVNKAAEKRGARPFRLVETAVKSRRQKCLNCYRPFESTGPGNRLCTSCGRHTAAPE